MTTKKKTPAEVTTIEMPEDLTGGEVEQLSHDEIRAMMKRDLESGRPIRPLTKQEKNIYGNTAMHVCNNTSPFTSAIAILRPFVDATAETTYVDKYGRVGLSYFFLYAVSPAVRQTWLLHEAMHVMNSHFARGDARGMNGNEINITGDLEINTTLSTLKWVDLEVGLLPEKMNPEMPKFKSMEVYSDLWREQLAQQSSQDSQNSKDGQSGQDQGGSENGSQNQGQQGDQGQQGEGQGQSGQSGNQQNGQGSGQGQQNSQGQGSGQGDPYKDLQDRFAKDLESGKKSPGGDEGQGSGEGEGEGSCQGHGQEGRTTCDKATIQRQEAADAAGIERSSEAMQEIARQNTRARIREEIERERSARRYSSFGSGDSFYEIMSALMSPPKVDWRKIFRSMVSRHYSEEMMGKTLPSYRRVNRRYGGGRIIFPGSKDVIPKVMFGIDTSGSMGKEDYRRSLTEIESITTGVCRNNRGIKCFSVDTEIGSCKPVRRVADVELTGGGGTDMSVAFRYVKNLPVKERPNIFILATDGYFDWNAVENELSEGCTFRSIILLTDMKAEEVPESVKRLASVLYIGEDDDAPRV